MKHYERLNLLETEVMHMRENLAIFKSVMEAHMNDFAKSQTDEGLALWRTLQLMETNTEQTYQLFYELFDDIKKDSQEQEAKQTNFYPGWEVKWPTMEALQPLDPKTLQPLIQPLTTEQINMSMMTNTLTGMSETSSVWSHTVDSIQKVTL